MPFLFIFLLAQDPLQFATGQEFEAEGTSEAIADQLQALKDNPIVLNTAKKEDLTKIYWISPELAEAIIIARTKKNGFKKISELKDVPGMSTQIFENIKPYIILTPLTKREYSIEIRERAQKTLPEEQNDIGSPEKVYQRIKLKYKKISGVMLLEKDAYEESYSDFMTYGLAIEEPVGTSRQGGTVSLQKVVFGDYALDFAEGLLFGIPPLITFKNQGMLKGKSTGIKSYTLSGENTCLRGIALESVGCKSLKNFLFYSKVPLDARVEEVAPLADEEVTIYYDYEGDHSTESGLAKKDRVKEELWGTRFEYTRNPKLGATYYKNTHFLNPERNKIGSHALFGFDLSSVWRGFQWFGEVSICDTVWAKILGVKYVTKKVKLGSLYRYYPQGFYIFHSAPWSDRTATTGSLAEKGNYFHGSYQFSHRTLLNCYFDYFTRLPKSSEEVSAQGFEYSGEVEHKFISNFSGITKYYFQKLDTTETTRFRAQTDIGIKNTNIRIRMEKAYEGQQKNGTLWYGNLEMKLFGASRHGGTATTIVAVRVILFDSEVRVYEAELDLPGVMTNRCLTGKGTRTYVYLKQKLSSVFAISLKYEVTSNADSETEKFGVQLDFKM